MKPSTKNTLLSLLKYIVVAIASFISGNQIPL